MDLSKNLKALIKKEDMTISQLAKRVDILVQTLHNWISSLEPRSLRQVRRVAEYFNVSIDYLCFGESELRDEIREYSGEINAGVFEVVLRRVKK